MKKFNVRPPVIIALAMCTGIAIALILYFYGLSAWWITLATIPALAASSVVVCVKRKPIRPLLFIIITLIIFIGGALNCFFTVKSYDNAEIEPDTDYTICGEVIEKGITSYGEYVIIDNITVNGRRIDGKMNVYLSSTYGELCDVGYTVEFYGSPQILKPFPYGELNYLAEDNIKYSISVYGGLESTYGYSFFGSIRGALRDLLFKNLSNETAAISYAMLTGNTQYMEEQSLESFRYGGIAHIFAVSGLHIGILFGITAFASKKLRVNKYLSAIICVGLILFYSAVCGFTLSSMRAVIMCTVAMLAKLFFQKYDGLNSLAVAVILILLITPLSLFSVGFQLSVCATGGIYVFSKLITKGLAKIKIPQKIRSAVGISFGAQIATTPVTLANFGYISAAGLLLNLIIIPLLSIIFAVIFFASFFCVLIPVTAPFIMPYAVIPLELFMSLFLGIGFEKALISGFGAGVFVPIYFVAALALSDKLNLKFLSRLVAVVGSAIILTTYVLFRYNYPFSGYSVIISAYGDGGEVLIKSHYGTVLIITDDVNISSLESMLHRSYLPNVDAVIILGDSAASTCGRLNFGCDEIYLNDNYPQIQPYEGILLKYENKFTVCGIECRFFDNDTLLINAGGFDIGICADEHFAMPDCDILISDKKNVFINCETEIYFNNRYGELNVFDCGDITFRIQNGKYSLKNIIPPRD